MVEGRKKHMYRRECPCECYAEGRCWICCRLSAGDSRTDGSCAAAGTGRGKDSRAGSTVVANDLELGGEVATVSHVEQLVSDGTQDEIGEMKKNERVAKEADHPVVARLSVLGDGDVDLTVSEEEAISEGVLVVKLVSAIVVFLGAKKKERASTCKKAVHVWWRQ